MYSYNLMYNQMNIFCNANYIHTNKKTSTTNWIWEKIELFLIYYNVCFLR